MQIGNITLNKRMIAFTIVTAVLCCFSAVMAAGVHNIAIPELAEETGSVTVDGADWTGFFRLTATILEGVIQFIACVVSFVLVTVGTLIAFVVLRFASIRPDSQISGDELDFSRIVLWGFTSGGFFLALALTGFEISWLAGLLFWQIPLFGSLLHIGAL
ncbi:MAG: hypothetical protein ACI4Q4_02800, partial [Oscillospiraceae bacterium]